MFVQTQLQAGNLVQGGCNARIIFPTLEHVQIRSVIVQIDLAKDGVIVPGLIVVNHPIKKKFVRR